MRISSRFHHLFLLLFIPFISQSQSFEWWFPQGGNGNFHQIKCLQSDLQGNHIAGGIFTNSIDIDPGTGTKMLTTSANDTSAYIAKYNPSGNLVWASIITSYNNCTPRSIAIDSSGNIYITGSFTDSVDMQPDTGKYILKSSGKKDVFVLILDATGKMLKAGAMGGSGEEVGYEIKLSRNGELIIAGEESGNADMDPGPSKLNAFSYGLTDMFILRLTRNIGYLGVVNYGGPNADKALSMDLDSVGNIYVTGTFSGTAYFSFQTIGGYGYNDIFLIKLTQTGALTWLRHIFSAGDEYPVKVICDEDKILLAGVYGDYGIHLDNPNPKKGPLSYGGRDIFLVSYKSYDSELIKFEGYGSVTDDICTDLIVSKKHHIILTGSLTSAINFNKNDLFGKYWLEPGKLYTPNPFVLKLDSAFKHIWSRGLKSNNKSSFDAVTTDTFENVIVSGNFIDTISLPGNSQYLTGKGNPDAMTFKFTNCKPLLSVIFPEVCLVYEAPSKARFIKSGIYYDTLVNPLSCDSVFEIHLTIKGRSISTIEVSACDSMISPSGKQIWKETGIYVDTLVNHRGCDSLIIAKYTNNKIDTGVTLNNHTLIANEDSAVYQWIDCQSGQIISGETNQTFTPKYNGYYKVSISKGQCSDTSECKYVYISGLPEIDRNSLKVYPNPSNGLIYFDLKESQILTISDLSGREIFSSLDRNTKQVVLSSGFYFFKLKDGNRLQCVKVIVK